MNHDFYNNDNGFCYPEIAICLEPIDSTKAKFYIPVATPLLSKNIAYDETPTKVITDNILSDKSTLNISPCTISNYVELKLPDDKPVKKGDTFIVVFLGGDINKPNLIGRCLENG